MIPIGNRHYCTVSGEVGKEEVCEKCGSKFAYQLHRTARGECLNLFWADNEGAAEAAKEDALNKLQKKLTNDFDIIACPTCGHMQSKMHRLFKSYILKLGLIVCLFVSFPSIILLAYWMDDFVLFRNQLQIGIIGLLIPITALVIVFLFAFLNPQFLGRMMRRRISKPDSKGNQSSFKH